MEIGPPMRGVTRGRANRPTGVGKGVVWVLQEKASLDIEDALIGFLIRQYERPLIS